VVKRNPGKGVFGNGMFTLRWETFSERRPYKMDFDRPGGVLRGEIGNTKTKKVHAIHHGLFPSMADRAGPRRLWQSRDPHLCAGMLIYVDSQKGSVHFTVSYHSFSEGSAARRSGFFCFALFFKPVPPSPPIQDPSWSPRAFPPSRGREC